MVLATVYAVGRLTTSETTRGERVWGSMAMAGLFFGLQISKQRFAAELRAKLAGHIAGHRNRRAWSLAQTFAQGIKLLMLPLSIVAVLPFAWTVAFFRNLIALEEDDASGAAGWWREAARQAGLGKAQSWMILVWLTPFTAMVMVNAAALLAALPYLSTVFTGYDNELVSNPRAILTWTFFMAAGSLTWLAIDPLLQAVYVVRCFAGQSVQTGADLRAALRRVAVVLLGLGLLTGPGTAREVSPAELQGRIHQVLQKPEYAWAAVRPGTGEPTTGNTWLDAAVDGLRRAGRWIGRVLDRFGEWLRQLFLREPIEISASRGGSPGETVRWAIIALLGLIALLLCAGLLRVFFKPRKLSVTGLNGPGRAVDPLAEEVLATELPEDEWLRLARDAMARGDYRVALRSVYLANLAWMGTAGLVTVSRFKSNREYERELRIRSRSEEATLLFSKNRAVFESAWYGDREEGSGEVELMERNLMAMRALIGA